MILDEPYKERSLIHPSHSLMTVQCATNGAIHVCECTLTGADVTADNDPCTRP